MNTRKKGASLVQSALFLLAKKKGRENSPSMTFSENIIEEPGGLFVFR